MVRNYENYYIVVADSINAEGINSIVTDVLGDVIRNINKCPDEWLAEIVSIVTDFTTDYRKEELTEEHNGYTWLDFINVVWDETKDRAIHNRHVASSTEGRSVITMNW